MTFFAVQSSPWWSSCSLTAATTLTTRTTHWTFESILAIPEGTVVHELCRKMSLVSRSSRCNKKWYVSVCKSVKKKEPLLKKKEDSTCLTFSEVEKNALCDLLTCYLPGDGDWLQKHQIEAVMRRPLKVKRSMIIAFAILR
ncbi:hypothetical protein AAC387_Pa06g1655 [Persea americana]